MQELRAQGAFACWQALRDARLDLRDEVPGSFGDCLEWAKRQFTSFFDVRGLEFFFISFLRGFSSACGAGPGRAGVYNCSDFCWQAFFFFLNAHVRTGGLFCFSGNRRKRCLFFSGLGLFVDLTRVLSEFVHHSRVHTAA